MGLDGRDGVISMVFACWFCGIMVFLWWCNGTWDVYRGFMSFHGFWWCFNGNFIGSVLAPSGVCWFVPTIVTLDIPTVPQALDFGVINTQYMCKYGWLKSVWDKHIRVSPYIQLYIQLYMYILCIVIHASTFLYMVTYIEYMRSVGFVLEDFTSRIHEPEINIYPYISNT